MAEGSSPITSELTIVCVHCHTQVKLSGVTRRRTSDENLTEYGLLCPSCNAWTHSYWMTPELAKRRDRLEELQIIYKRKPTEGRWTTYVTAREAYNKEFELVQKRYGRRVNEAETATAS